MDWQLPNIGKTITNNILPSILSAHTVSILRFHLVSIGRFRQCIDMLVGYFCSWFKYVGKIPFPSIRNDLYIAVVLVVFWQTDTCKRNWEIIHDQTHTLYITGVISLSASCWCYCWQGRGHNLPTTCRIAILHIKKTQTKKLPSCIPYTFQYNVSLWTKAIQTTIIRSQLLKLQNLSISLLLHTDILMFKVKVIEKPRSKFQGQLFDLF